MRFSFHTMLVAASLLLASPVLAQDGGNPPPAPTPGPSAGPDRKSVV